MGRFFVFYDQADNSIVRIEDQLNPIPIPWEDYDLGFVIVNAIDELDAYIKWTKADKPRQDWKEKLRAWSRK